MLSSFYCSSVNLPKIRIWVLVKMWLHLPVLVPSAFPLVWRYGGKLEVCSSKNGGKSFTATKGGGRVAHGKQASHFAIRYAVSQFCHYQRSVTAVLENEVFCSERLLWVTGNTPWPEVTRVGLPYVGWKSLAKGCWNTFEAATVGTLGRWKRSYYTLDSSCVLSPKQLCWDVSCGDRQSHSSRFQLKRLTFTR